MPRVHIFIPKDKRPQGVYQLFRVYTRKWLVHPIKRRVARYYLVYLKKFFGLKVIGITGSAGKTTTKEMLHSILSQKYKVVSTIANIDPIYNIPTTILKARPSTQFLILEMGIEFPGEMDFYLWLAKPDVAILTTLNLTHTEFLGSLAGVIEEKTKLIKAIKGAGAVFLNADDKEVVKAVREVHGTVVFYGMGKKAKIQGLSIAINDNLETEFILQVTKRRIRIKLPTVGRQNVSNALAAAAVGDTFGVPIQGIRKGLESFAPQPHRLTPIKLKSGTILIDDVYNSNPLAAGLAIEVLASLPAKRRIAVLGDMKELGRFEKSAHKKMGTLAADLGLDEVIGFGEAAKILVDSAKDSGVKKAWLAHSKEKIARYLRKQGKGTVVLIKGSRSLGMESIVADLVR